jgi:hypothetical protein
MTIKTTIDSKQYLKLMFMLAYKKPVLILLVLFDLLMITWVVGYYMKWISWLPEPEYPQYLSILLITFVQPAVIYFTIRKNYKTSIRLYGEVTITFSREKVITSGRLFYAEYLWCTAYKLVELKNWFLIYENNFAAILIDKKDLSPEDQQQFRELVKTIPHLHLKLREPSITALPTVLS